MQVADALSGARGSSLLFLSGTDSFPTHHPFGYGNATRRRSGMDDVVDVDGLIDALIDREGGFVDHPADKGGPTCFGITQAVARAHGYAGPMRQLPRSEAVAIYLPLYWARPRLEEVAKRSGRLAAELFDTGVNMGPAVAITFLQRALTALNRGGKDYADLTPDGRIGPATVAALDTFLKIRGTRSGETVLLRALEALQGERYLRLAERRPANEAFLYGWLANRIGER
jgi:lysozyme family protein